MKISSSLSMIGPVRSDGSVLHLFVKKNLSFQTKPIQYVNKTRKLLHEVKKTENLES